MMVHMSIQQCARACVYSRNVMRCSLCCLCDLLEHHFSGLLVAALLPSAFTKVFSWSEESRYTEREDTAIFQRVEGDVCVCVSHLDVLTHRGTQRLVYRHMQTEERGAGGEVAGQGDGVRQDHGMFDKETGTRCWVSGVVMFGVCECVCVCACHWQTPWGVADRHQLPVNNVCWTTQNGFTTQNNWYAGI